MSIKIAKNRLLKMKEVTQILHVSHHTLRNWDEKGTLKAVRFGVRKDRRYRPEDIEQMLYNKPNESD